jgi:hypothetical protein
VKLLLLIFLGAGALAGEDLPLMGLAHVGIRVSDLESARAFYSGVLGFENAFTTTIAYMKVNDHQFIELLPGLKAEDVIPMTHIAMWTEDLKKTREMCPRRSAAWKSRIALT